MYFNWRLITILYWFCHTSTWICQRCTHVSHPDPSSHLPLCTIPLLFHMLSRLVIAFLSNSKSLLISWLQSSSAVILEPPKMKSITVSIISPSTCHEVMGLDAMILVFWMLSFKRAFSLSSFTFIKRLFRSSLLSAICFLPLEWYCLHIWGCYCFSLQSWFQLVIHPARHFEFVYLLFISAFK